jgi:flagellar M-ring protein FliF
MDSEALEPGMAPSALAAPAPVAPVPSFPAAAAEFTANQAELGIDRMRLDIDRLAATSPERTADFLRSLMDDQSLA